jgi:hypothetical protein
MDFATEVLGTLEADVAAFLLGLAWELLWGLVPLVLAFLLPWQTLAGLVLEELVQIPLLVIAGAVAMAGVCLHHLLVDEASWYLDCQALHYPLRHLLHYWTHHFQV